MTLDLLRRIATCLLTLALLAPAVAARADAVDLTSFEVVRGDDGVTLSFGVSFDLARSVEDALQKGVPLHFVAEADLYSDRWYWRDRKIATATRAWRLAYQPLTRKYRVTFGGLNQSYDSLPDALSAVRRVGAWKIADAAQMEDSARHYVEFSYRLDTTQLPRPMQIGIGGSADWTLSVERVQRFN